MFFLPLLSKGSFCHLRHGSGEDPRGKVCSNGLALIRIPPADCRSLNPQHPNHELTRPGHLRAAGTSGLPVPHGTSAVSTGTLWATSASPLPPPQHNPTRTSRLGSPRDKLRARRAPRCRRGSPPGAALRCRLRPGGPGAMAGRGRAPPHTAPGGVRRCRGAPLRPPPRCITAPGPAPERGGPGAPGLGPAATCPSPPRPGAPVRGAARCVPALTSGTRRWPPPAAPRSRSRCPS